MPADAMLGRMDSLLVRAFDSLAAERAGELVLTIDDLPLTGAELDRMARVHAARVLALGLAPGDRVASMAPTTAASVAALIAHLRLGLMHVPLNTRYQPPEIAHVLADSGAHHLAEDSEPPEPIAAWPAPPPADAVALVVYTSGTTGRAKGVMLGHGALAANLAAMMTLWQVTPRDVVSHALPLFHVHGLGLGVLGPLLAGAALRLRTKFQPRAAIADFARGASLFMGVPTMYHALLEHLTAAPEDALPLAGGRLFTAGSAALPAAVLDAFARLTGHRILERYGMTETLFTLSNPHEGERRAGSVGLPVPGAEVRLVDEHGQPVPPGEPGEIEVRGAGLMHGYWQNPGATAASFRDGWFKTGDIAVADADGYHRIVGRSSTDIIKSGGFKIGTREIEDVLLAHPGVREATVVGLPDERWGEVVAAALVMSGDLAPHELDAELDAWCAHRLADFKRPRRIIAVARLPRNAMGKVMKHEVRALFITRS